MEKVIQFKPAEQGYDFDLGGLQKKLEELDYYGTITLVFQKGEIVLIREERTMKPNNFDRLMG